MAPIHDAARDANVGELHRLLAEGVSLDARDHEPHGLLPIQHCAARTTDVDDRVACFKLLREAGADLEARSSPSANTALHFAASAGCIEIMSLLVEAGVNVNARNNQDSTPLRFAAYGDRRALESVELLLEAGAAVNVRCENGSTPFDIALRRRDNRRMWPLFLRAGAEIPVPNTDPYIVRVRNAGGFKKYEQAHLARITAILETPLLPPELVRKILEFWLHAGYY